MAEGSPGPDSEREPTAGDVRRRFAWARRRGHPRYVWPEVPVAAWLASARAVEAAVAAGLCEGGRAGIRLGAPAGTVALGVAAYTTGCGPLLGRWIGDGTLEAPPDVAELLALHLEHGRRRAARSDALLRSACAALEAAGVRPILLKGAHTARSVFPEPGVRPAADLDLLVPTDRFRDAERALEAAGFNRILDQRALARSAWLPPGADHRIRSVHLDHADNPLTLDLHASLARSFSGVRVVDPGVPGSGELVAVPEAPDGAVGLRSPLLYLTLALHASEELQNLQLVRLVELVLVGREMNAMEAGSAEVARRARALDALRFLYPALALARALAPDSVDPAVLEEARADAPTRMLRVVGRLTPGTAQRLERASLEERFMWARGAREVLGRLRHMLAPDNTGGSVRALARLYLERVHRALSGRASVTDALDTPASPPAGTPLGREGRQPGTGSSRGEG